MHVNMLKRWHELIESCYWTDVSDDGNGDEVPTWCNDQSKDEIPAVGKQLKVHQRTKLMDRLLQGISSFTAPYLDDLVIFSTSWKEHVRHLRLTSLCRTHCQT